jgi:predicted CoA-binding protein
MKKMLIPEAIEHATRMRNVAIVGVEEKGTAFVLMKGLLDRGYFVHPVNPDVVNTQIHGRDVYSSLLEIEGIVELVYLHIENDGIEYWMNELSERMETRADIEAIWFDSEIELGKAVKDVNDFGWMLVLECSLLSEVIERNIDFQLEDAVNEVHPS